MPKLSKKQGTGVEIFELPVSPPKAKVDNIEKITNNFSAKLRADFFKHDIRESDKGLRIWPETYWLEKGRKRALKLFRAAAARVPAYKDFLKKNKVDPEKIKTFAHFQEVPWIDKNNYLKEYPLDMLSWDGLLQSNSFVSVSSGSSGVPCYWPRGTLLETETAYVQEMYLRNYFEVDKYKTLYVDAFAMGMYIAGPIIMGSAQTVAQKGYPMTVITPGLEMTDVCNAMKGLVKYHNQVVLAGYAPFIKDIITTCLEKGVNWSKIKTRFLLAGEGINESWRDHVAELVGQKTLEHDFINIYGTADASIVGHETPFSISIRRLAIDNPDIMKSLFPEKYGCRMPTFVQYYPTLKYFEKIDNELVFTATAGIPLVRYNIHDVGGVLSAEEVDGALRGGGSSLKIIKRKLKEKGAAWNLPFVYLYGKSDYTATLYGLNIYPENIKAGLEDPVIRNEVTGKFTMSTEYKKESQDQYLQIHVELRQGLKPKGEMTKKVRSTIAHTLRNLNAEFAKLCSSIGMSRANPRVKLIRYGTEKYFPRTIKHRWKN